MRNLIVFLIISYLLSACSSKSEQSKCLELSKLVQSESNLSSANL